jgi:hypothetical protein
MADRLDLQLISAALRRLGWVRFWVQVALGVVVVGVLMFNNIGGRLAANSSRALGLGPGISLTTLSFLLLLWCHHDISSFFDLREAYVIYFFSDSEIGFFRVLPQLILQKCAHPP